MQKLLTNFAKQQKNPFFIALKDYEKAYDKVNRKQLMKILDDEGSSCRSFPTKQILTKARAETSRKPCCHCNINKDVTCNKCDNASKKPMGKSMTKRRHLLLIKKPYIPYIPYIPESVKLKLPDTQHV